MKTTILRAAYNACSGEGVLGDALRYDVGPLTKSFPRSQLCTAPSCQNDASHRHAGFAQNRPQMKCRKTTSQERSSLAFHSRPVLCSSVTPGLQSVAQWEPCIPGGLLTVSAGRLPSSENTSASCFLPTCRIVWSSRARKLTVARCFHVMVSPFVEGPNQVPGHNPIKIHVDHIPDP